MSKIKLPKVLLATEHLLIRKRAKRSVFNLAKEENRGIADLIEEMINCYLDKRYTEENNSVRKLNYIT